MEEKKYLKLYNKVGYGGGDFAANMVYGLISSFVMIYLTNTIGMDAGIIGFQAAGRCYRYPVWQSDRQNTFQIR